MQCDLQCCYDTLELSRGASAKAVKEAYRRLAMTHHPDRNRGQEAASTPMFQRIKEAADILRGERAKPATCTCGRQGTLRDAGSMAGGVAQDDFTHAWDEAREFDTHTKYASQQQKGSNVHATIWVPLATAFAGGMESVPVDTVQLCAECGGKGKCKGFSSCATCDGTGKVAVVGRWGGDGTCASCGGDGRSTWACFCGGSGVSLVRKWLEVFVPPRTGAGVVLSVKGAGHIGVSCEDPGDAFFTVQILAQPNYLLTGLDIEGPASLDCMAAILGGTTEVIVLGSKVTANVLPNSGPGTRIHIRGGGLRSSSGQAGDLRLYAILDVLNPIDSPLRDKLRAALADGANKST